jgi:hypothetical protein
MDQLKRFVWPIAVGGVVVIIAMIGLLGWIVPEGHKVSTANVNKVSLEAQETSLQAEINGLKDESTHEPANCTALRQDLQLVPETPTVDLFLHQISQLASNSRTQTPSVGITSSGGASGAVGGGAQTVGITLSVAGTYQQVLNFLNGLDNVHALQRLFSVGSVTLSNGQTQASSNTKTGYSLELQGNIYYSSTQQDVCSNGPNSSASSST